jgi:hypothetical protein
VTVTREAIAVPDSTEPTLALLRELRHGQARKRASGIAYWIYVAALFVLFFGGAQITAAYRVLRHPPHGGADALSVLHAAPGSLAALGLLVLLVLLRDALWRGPVTLPAAAVSWLLGTPVSRGPLLRPRFHRSAVTSVLAGAVVGIVPAIALVTNGLGGHDTGSVLRLTGAAMVSTALLFALGTGAGGLVERHPAARMWLRRATPAAVAWAAVLGGLAGWAAAGRPPAALDTIALWAGPWGWAAQPMIALAGGSAPLWPLATALLAVLALAALAVADRETARIPGSALRARAQTLSAMSAARASFDTRGFALAYSRAGSPRRARFRLRPPRRRGFVLLWRDMLALARAPSRLVGAAALALLAVGMFGIAAASHSEPGQAGHAALLPVAAALGLGYLAAAWLCESARLDADDTRRSALLPFRYDSLAWWHAAVPCAVFYVVAGVPAVALSVAAGDPRLLALLAVTVPVLVGGALVNVFRPAYPPDLFGGFETPVGNSAVFPFILWLTMGPLVSVLPMTLLLSAALGSSSGGPLTRAVVLGAGLAVALGAFAAHRARNLRAG